MKNCLFLSLLLFAILSTLCGQEENSPDPIQPRLITPIQAVMPLALQNAAIENPKVVAKVQVSGAGRVEDLVVLEASHIGLVNRAETLLRKALIDPGDIRPNESIRFEMVLPFLYPADLGLPNKSTSDDIQIMIASLENEERSLNFYSAEELDEPVAIVDRGVVYKPDDEEGNLIPGNAVVELYINHEGRVRLPRVISSTHDEVALAALASFADLRFSIPLYNGRPAVTRIRLPFKVD
jgi:hypothetical protein